MAKKAMSKKEISEMVSELDAAQKKQEQEISEFQKRSKKFGEEIDKLSSKYKMKVLIGGYDEESNTPFIMGCRIKSDFEARAMESYLTESISRSRR